MASASTTTAGTTFLQTATACDEKYTERWLFNRHYMFMDDEMFYRFIQCGLVDKIIDVFRVEDRKNTQTTSVSSQKRKNTDSSPHEEVTGKKTRRTSMTLVDAATQTEDSSILDLSSQPSVGPTSSSSSATVVQAVDAYALVEKRRYHSSLLARYKMYLRKIDLYVLDRHGLLDQLVEVVEDVDRTTNSTSWRSIHDQASTEVHGNHGISEGVEEDSEDDEDEDYEFELTSEEEEDDEEEQIEQNRSDIMTKDLLKDKLVYIDAWIQTVDDAAHI